jgi:hypothetical protein
MSARLWTAGVEVSAPSASLNRSGAKPFAVVRLDGDGGTYLTIYAPADARELAAVLTQAAELLEQAQAGDS